MNRRSGKIGIGLIYLTTILTIFFVLPANIAHADYTYTTIDVPGAFATWPRGISGNNIVGYYSGNTGEHAFVYNGTTYTTLNVPNAVSAQAFGVSGNITVGNYFDGSAYHGFQYNGAAYATLDVPGAMHTYANGVAGNNVVGHYLPSGGGVYGFIYNGTSYTTLPSAPKGGTWPMGISGNNIVGFYGDETGAHGFIYNGTSYTTLDVPAPGTINTYANGISGNIVVGDYQDGSGYHGFIYDGTSYTTFDYPDASGTYIQGITENNIVGYYGAAHGFIVTPIPVPSPPTAKCQNVTVVAGPSCTAPASIDNGSYENGSPVTLTQTPAGPYSLGTTPVTLTVTDGKGASNQCTGTVTVQDKTPPAITMASVNPSVLWPPNHKMVDVMVNYTSTDNCSSQPTCTISGVTSNEPISSSDYSIVGAHHVELSADRLGGGNGRIYTIPIACTDASGNLSTQTMAVSVPHDQGKK